MTVADLITILRTLPAKSEVWVACQYDDGESEPDDVVGTIVDVGINREDEHNGVPVTWITAGDDADTARAARGG